MTDFFFQIVLFLAGTVLGITIPLLRKKNQKFMAGVLSILLVGVSLIWIGYEIGTREIAKPEATLQPAAIVGRVTWNDLPIEGISVTLIDGHCDGITIAKTLTDSSGNYRFGNVEPGDYTIGINGFIWQDDPGSVEKNPLYESSCYSYPFTLKENEESRQDRAITKLEFIVYPPSFGAPNIVIPTFSWEPYPDTSYYLISLFQREPSFKQVFVDARTISTSIISKEPLKSGNTYDGWVAAYNADGIEIARGFIYSFMLPGE